MMSSPDNPWHPCMAVPRRKVLKAGVAGLAMLPFAAFLAACEGTKSDAGKQPANSDRARKLVLDFHGGRVAAPTLFNPFVTGFTINAGFHQALSEPLFILNYQTGKMEPWLGESFTSNAALDRWTLKIKDKIKWSDGEAYDADDIVFTVRMLMKHPDLNYGAAMQQWVKSVSKLDATTVEFALRKPNPRFSVDYFAVKLHNSTIIVPEHIWKDQDPLKFKNYDKAKGWPVFTGPYSLVSAAPTLFTYTRRDDWWGAAAGFKALPVPERLEWVVNETEDIRVARASDHEIDSVADLTAGAFESLKARNTSIVSWLPDKPYAWPDPCTRLLSLNNAIEPWNDREMRWALNYALDKEQISAIAYEGTTTPARFFFPNYPAMQKYVDLIESKGLFKEYPLLDHDADKAMKIFESKGYTRKAGGYYTKNGKQLRLQIDAPTDFIEIWRYADVIGEQLQKVGINATVRKLAIATWGENIGMGKFEAASDWSACGSVTEPWGSMSLFTADTVTPIGKTSNSNSQRWANATYTKAVNSMADLPLGDPGLEAPFLTAAREWLHDLPFIPVTYSRKLYAFDTQYWTGWATTEDPYLEPTLDWGNAHRIIHNLKPA